MDDFPASPASRGPRRLSLSVVIPVHNGGRDFEHCLRRLRDSSHSDFELIVVDDGSTDSSAQVAESFGGCVHRHVRALGPAAARNTGAKVAGGSIIFFLDADVAVHADTLAKVVDRFEANPRLSALFGSYDDAPSAPGLVSRYRNLLHHYVHQQGDFAEDARPVHTFWTGCGAIRRELFLDLGGFDPERYRRPAIEDIELGYRIQRSGGLTILARDIQATHLKRWRLRDVLRTDILQRGVPWMLLLKRSDLAETDLNVSLGQRASVLATGVGAASLLLIPISPWLALGWPISLVAIASLNRHFYAFLARRRGLAFALASVGLHYLYFWCCGISVAIAESLWHLRLKHQTRRTALERTTIGIRRDGPETPPTPRSEGLRAGWRTPPWIRRNRPSSPSSARIADDTPSPKRSP